MDLLGDDPEVPPASVVPRVMRVRGEGCVGIETGRKVGRRELIALPTRELDRF
jgi:hypothetical protein